MKFYNDIILVDKGTGEEITINAELIKKLAGMLPKEEPVKAFIPENDFKIISLMKIKECIQRLRLERYESENEDEDIQSENLQKETLAKVFNEVVSIRNSFYNLSSDMMTADKKGGKGIGLLGLFNTINKNVKSLSEIIEMIKELNKNNDNENED